MLEIKIDMARFNHADDPASPNEVLFQGFASKDDYPILKRISREVREELEKHLRFRKLNPEVRADQPVSEPWVGHIRWTGENGVREGFLFNDSGFPITFGFEKIEDGRSAEAFRKILLRLLAEKIIDADGKKQPAIR